VLECVVNVSEGRDQAVLGRLADAGGDELLDLHADAHHHRAVLTLVGVDAPRRVATVAVDAIDVSRHEGSHPRLGAVDVVPFVPLEGSTMAEAVEARDDFAEWMAADLDVPVFLYGPERTLPEIRRRAFRDLAPDVGPPSPHPTAGACCVGARDVLVAYNLWLTGASLAQARAVAAEIRGPELRALGLEVGDAVQVSMNLVAPGQLGPAAAHDLVAAALDASGASIERAELVGLVPTAVLEAVDPARWGELGLSADQTIEARVGS
jgi:glutamate formiminotransferase